MEPTKNIKKQQVIKEVSNNKRSINFSIDPILFIIFLVSFATRYYNLEHPRAVVFDELHYIKFITLYAKRIFFFDPQPPFGKQLMTIVSYLVGFDGDLSYSQIGELYQPQLPIRSLRLLPCICGSLIAPVCYLISIELGLCQSISTLVSFLIILENSLLTQSKFLLLDPILVVFSIFSIYSYLKFKSNNDNEKYLNSILWLCLASLTSTLAACTKYSGFYSVCLLIFLVTYYWWQSLDEHNYRQYNNLCLSMRNLVFKTIIYLACIIVLPVMVYISIHYAHLAWLTKAGPHDNIMTSAFQASLEGGLASITRGQPLEIVHGSQITLRHTHGRSCWLHSHEHLYPVKYSDGRGSSHQQQVTCYSFKDINNWWIVKRPHIDELVVTEPSDKIKDGDLIQLVHGISGRSLNSHDVASAMSPYSQEVSCYVDHNISMPAQNVWQVRLNNPQDTNGNWHTLNSRFQLIHLNSSLALKFSGRQLPDWGYHQHEIVADKDLKSLDTIWNVEEHRHTKSEDQKEREIQFGQAEFVPLEPTSLTFFEKFYELHYKLFNYHQDIMKDHIYACESPLDWMFSSKGTAYWVNSTIDSIEQIFLIGNVSINYMGLLSAISLFSMIIYYILRRRRLIFDDIDEKYWSKLQLQFIVLFSGYLIHLCPYFFYESPLFLQYYLNALVFKVLIIGAFIQHMHDKLYFNLHISNGLIIGLALITFIKLSPLSYGFQLNRQQIQDLRWKDTWQLITLNA